MTIYQVFTRLFGSDQPSPVPHGTKAQNGCGRMADFTARALSEIRALGCTHVWYTGIIEHATHTDYSRFGIRRDDPSVVKGRAGSPYAIKDYYDVDPDLATRVPNRMKEFEQLVHRTHEAGLGVVIDFVPNHVARQYHSDAAPDGVSDLGAEDDVTLGFSPQNNFYYLPWDSLHLDDITTATTYVEQPAKATGNDGFTAWPSRTDWYETVKLNYGVDICAGRVGHFDPVPDTWRKMLHILHFWAAKGVDAFRCDMAEMVPVEFWEWAIAQVKAQYPAILFIAEVYNPAEYRSFIHRGGFDYLYDKVGLYDTLKAVAQGHASTQCITAAWQQVDDIHAHMLNFLENHDEQRVASDFFLGNALRGRAPLLVSALMRGNPMMVYFGQELGERGMDEEGFSGCDGRTTIFDYWTVDTIRRWRNGGAFDGAALTPEEQALRDYYQCVLTLREQHAAFSNGAFYDLMYVNPWLHHQYAFARRGERELLLVVANFSDEAQTVSLQLPQHLFDFWHLEQRPSLMATELLTGKRRKMELTYMHPIAVKLPALGGVVLDINIPKTP